jgi:hypothetical protein
MSLLSSTHCATALIKQIRLSDNKHLFTAGSYLSCKTPPALDTRKDIHIPSAPYEGSSDKACHTAYQVTPNLAF